MISTKEMMPVYIYEMSLKVSAMLLSLYERMGLNMVVSLAYETVVEITRINEDASQKDLRHRLSKNFYDAEISVLVARFMVAEATLNVTKASDKIFRAMLEARHYVFEAIKYWLSEHGIKYDNESLWDELRNLGACLKVYQINKKMSDE